MPYLWKSMGKGLKSGYNGEEWVVGKWKKIKGKPKLCSNGYHASKNVMDAMRYTDMECLAKVEVKGKSKRGDDKQVWTEMRVVQAWKWEKKDSVALAVYIAELVIGIFENEYPDDKRPREAIEVAKAWLKNPTKKNQSAASAASAAAWAAASAASAAASNAAGDAAAASAAGAASAAAWAASNAARDAAGAAAWAAASNAASNAAGDAILKKCHRFVLRRRKQLEEIK